MTEKTNSKESHKPKFWKIILIAVIFIIIIIGVFVGLVIYSTSLKVEVWWMDKTYKSGWFLSPSVFTAKVKVAIGNPSVFSTVLEDARVKIYINNVYMGTFSFEEWEIISSQSWSVWTITASIQGEDADLLEQAQTYTVRVILKGKASCFFYSRLIEIWHERVF